MSGHGRVLAHLHVVDCPCSRCRTARNYARLLAAVALRDEAEAAEHGDAQLRVPVARFGASDLDVMGRAVETTPV